MGLYNHKDHKRMYSSPGVDTGNPICLILPSLVSPVYAFTCLFCLSFHLSFAFKIFLFIRRHFAADCLPFADDITQRKQEDQRRYELGMNFCIIFLSYNKEVNH